MAFIFRFFVINVCHQASDITTGSSIIKCQKVILSSMKAKQNVICQYDLKT